MWLNERGEDDDAEMITFNNAAMQGSEDGGTVTTKRLTL